jgi:hypothetical protein
MVGSREGDEGLGVGQGGVDFPGIGQRNHRIVGCVDDEAGDAVKVGKITVVTVFLKVGEESFPNDEVATGQFDVGLAIFLDLPRWLSKRWVT